MRTHGVVAGAAAAVMVAGGLGVASPAHASDYGVELNGTYTAVLNGEWSTTNDMFYDVATIRSIWSITSSCTAPTNCTGEVTSDQGWTAPMRFVGAYWQLDRVVEGWEPCPDGTTAPGNLKALFWGVDTVTGKRDDKNTTLLAGWEETKSPSGSCGVNKPLVIRTPLRLEKI